MRKFKPAILLICLCLFLCATQGPARGGTYDVEPTLELNKTSFEPGETIVVTFTASPDYTDDAWVGIVPSEVPHGDEAVNDQHDITYQYLNGLTEGDLEFEAPLEPGSYDLRLHDTDYDGAEVASVSFEVVDVMPKLMLERTSFRAGETIVVAFTAPAAYPNNAWVGVIPSHVPHGDEAVNDQHDLAWQYLGGQTGGVLEFAAPYEPGSYDLRMHDSDVDGAEVASVTFEVASD